MNSSPLPAGLFNDNTAELFAANDKAYCMFNGTKQEVSTMPTRIKMAIVSFYKSRPGTERAYEAMVGTNENDKIEQCIKCMFANFDNATDVDANGIMIPEVVNCSKRGNCKHEKIGCLPSISVDNLSPAQQRVVQLCHLPAKEIADILFLSPNTVKKHLQDARIATGARNSRELSRLLSNSKLIN